MTGTLFIFTMLPSIYYSGCHMAHIEPLLSKRIKKYALCEGSDLFSGGFHSGHPCTH